MCLGYGLHGGEEKYDCMPQIYWLS
jgi:hypothetical protein